MTRDEMQHELRHATTDLHLQVRHINNNIHKIEDVVDKVSTMVWVRSITVMRELIVIPWHPKLKEVVCWVMKQWPESICFTSGFRVEKGVHGQDPLRGTDLRSRAFKYPHSVEKTINKEWDYGKPPYQVCLYHQTVLCRKCGGKFEVNPDIGVIPSTICPKCRDSDNSFKDFGPHFHLQVRDQTRKR
jgi:hypothetical protein